MINKLTDEINDALNKVCGYSSVDLEGKFECSRGMETNIGNWICDVINTSFDGNSIVILNSGCIRSNEVFPTGHFTFKTLA